MSFKTLAAGGIGVILGAMAAYSIDVRHIFLEKPKAALTKEIADTPLMRMLMQGHYKVTFGRARQQFLRRAKNKGLSEEALKEMSQPEFWAQFEETKNPLFPEIRQRIYDYQMAAFGELSVNELNEELEYLTSPLSMKIQQTRDKFWKSFTDENDKDITQIVLLATEFYESKHAQGSSSPATPNPAPTPLPSYQPH